MHKVLIPAALAAALLGAPALRAQEAEVTLAEHGLQARIDALAGQPEHGFELGMLQTLRGVERALQTGYGYEIDTGMVQVPVLRLLKPRAGAPTKRPGPEALAQGVTAFLGDMDSARAFLDTIPEGSAPAFELTLQDIWFDIDSNGQRSPNEGAVDVLAAEVLGWRAMQTIRANGVLDRPLTIRFDRADRAWLRAYTHMLSGVGEAILAFDPAPVLTELAAYSERLNEVPQKDIGDAGELQAELDSLEHRRPALQAQLSEIQAQFAGISAQIDDLGSRIRAAPDDAGRSALEAERSALFEQRSDLYARQVAVSRDLADLDRAIATLRVRLGAAPGNFRDRFGREVDAVYILLATLRQQPDADHAGAVRDHWKAMIVQNRIFWAALDAETDNDREWIPNPRQQSALPLEVPEDIREIWLAVLEDADKLLDGDLLVPHPLLPAGYGIDLAAWFDDPSPLNILDWVHGIGAIDYTARGPAISAANWRALNQLTGGNAGAFALFLN